ncbi:hypothetical protein AnigIFM63309_002935 [Aspergillus niger]|nr:hypothetical protein AnigIFM63309_002935 [Aspergillus niger]
MIDIKDMLLHPALMKTISTLKVWMNMRTGQAGPVRVSVGSRTAGTTRTLDCNRHDEDRSRPPGMDPRFRSLALPRSLRHDDSDISISLLTDKARTME